MAKQAKNPELQVLGKQVKAEMISRGCNERRLPA
jgi:hypothetical protein